MAVLCDTSAGKGTYKWVSSGAIYDGDWKEGKRSGFGTYSIPTGPDTYRKQYSGGWKNGKKHVSTSTLD